MKRSSWKDEYLYSVRLFKKRRRLLVFLVQAFSIIISFTATTNVKTVLAEEKLDRHNKSDLIEFIQPEYDGIIVDTNSSMQFVISTNYNHIIETFKVCFRLLVTKEDDINHQTSTKTECKNFTVDNNTGRFTVIFNRKMHESSIVSGVANVLPKVRLTGAPITTAAIRLFELYLSAWKSLVGTCFVRSRILLVIIWMIRKGWFH